MRKPHVASRGRSRTPRCWSNAEPMRDVAYIALGSNLGRPLQDRLSGAHIVRLPSSRVVAESSIDADCTARPTRPADVPESRWWRSKRRSRRGRFSRLQAIEQREVARGTRFGAHPGSRPPRVTTRFATRREPEPPPAVCDEKREEELLHGPAVAGRAPLSRRATRARRCLRRVRYHTVGIRVGIARTRALHGRLPRAAPRLRASRPCTARVPCGPNAASRPLVADRSSSDGRAALRFEQDSATAGPWSSSSLASVARQPAEARVPARRGARREAVPRAPSPPLVFSDPDFVGPPHEQRHDAAMCPFRFSVTFAHSGITSAARRPAASSVLPPAELGELALPEVTVGQLGMRHVEVASRSPSGVEAARCRDRASAAPSARRASRPARCSIAWRRASSSRGVSDVSSATIWLR